jgi:hypothetical protein
MTSRWKRDSSFSLFSRAFLPLIACSLLSSWHTSCHGTASSGSTSFGFVSPAAPAASLAIEYTCAAHPRLGHLMWFVCDLQ